MELIDESMTDSGLNELIKMADVDKDGRINYEGIPIGKTSILWNPNILSLFLEFAKMLL